MVPPTVISTWVIIELYRDALDVVTTKDAGSDHRGFGGELLKLFEALFGKLKLNRDVVTDDAREPGWRQLQQLRS